MMFQYFKKHAARGKSRLRIGVVCPNDASRRNFAAIAPKVDDADFTFIDKAALGKPLPATVNVVVYDLDVSSQSSFAEFERFMADQPATVPVVVVSPSLDEDIVRWLLRLRVADWVKTPFTAGELIVTCARALSQATSLKKDAKCLAFVGVRGGVGTTTLAIHAALALQGKSRDPATCLVDLDFNESACADYLDLQPNWAVDDLIPNPERMDSHMLNGVLAHHRTGLTVMSGHRKYGAEGVVTDEVITRPLDLAVQKFSSLVIDVPRSAGNWADSVILGASDLFLVTEFTVPGLKSARRMVAEMVERFGDQIKPRVIVNRYERSLFSSSLSSTEAKELLGPFLAGLVPLESKLVHEAVNRGIPTTDIKSRNSILSEISKIVGATA